MPRKKDGTNRLDGSAMRAIALTHEQFARELLWLAQRSNDALQGRKVNDELEGLNAASRAVVRARWRLEDTGPADKSDDSRELRLALDSLVALAELQMKHGALWLAASEAYRPGHPGTTSDDFATLLEQLSRRAAGRPGRRPLVDISDAALLGTLAAYKSSGKSERQILAMVSQQWLSGQGKHVAGDRVDRITRNLQKRVASARGVRK